MSRNGALSCLLGLAGLAACGGDSMSGGLEPGAMSQPGDTVTTGGEASGPVGGSADGSSPGACRQPTPPELCLFVPERAVSSSLSLGPNSFAYTWQLTAAVAALEQGPLEEARGTHHCALGYGEPSAPDTHLEWLRLDVGDDTAWLALSAPPEGLGVEAGDTVEVEYTVVDDLLIDFPPQTISLALRDAASEPLAWLATSDSVASLGEQAPPWVTLSQGAAQCETEDTCLRFEQRELNVGIGGRELVLTQGELVGESGWRALAGRSEVVTGEPGACSIDGYTQLASVALWRAPE